MDHTKLSPPMSWRNPGNHFVEAIRSPWYRLLVELQDTITSLTVGFWSSRGVKNLHLPITTGSVSSPMGLGSDSAPVQIEMFGVATYLADSMQFGLEYGTRFCERGSYYIMPSFRGEEVDKTHLAQFFHSEAEIPGCLDDVIHVVEDYIKHLCRGVLQNLSDELYAAVGDLSHVESVVRNKAPFTRLRFSEAASMLRKHQPGLVKCDEAGWYDLTRAGEQRLMDECGEFLWVTHWDHMAVPFYQAFDGEDKRTARNADLLFGIGEVVGAGERHTTGAEVTEALQIHNVNPAEYAWYCEMKDRFPMKTSGFGMGVERFVLWLLNHDDIRDLQLLPRINGRNIVP